MSTPIFDPDDPRLTAYALGELPDAEREAVEALLVTSPEARAAIDETRALSRRLEAEFAHENAAYQQANPPRSVATNVVPFPRPARRWQPAATQALKIAAVFFVLGALAFAMTRRQPPTSVAIMAPPPAAPAMKEAPAPPPADEMTPAGSAAGLAANETTPAATAAGPAGDDNDARESTAKSEAPPPDLATDRLAQASVRRARVAEAAPGAPRRPLPAAAAPMAPPAASLDERLAAATVRVRLDDGTYVGGVVLTADGLILAAGKLPAIKNPGHSTVVLADGREFAPSATAVMQNVSPGLFRIKGALLPTVALATQTPAEGSQLVLAHIDTRTGETTFQRTAASQAGNRATLVGDVSGADFVFDAAGKLLAMEEVPAMAKSAARAQAAVIRDKAAPAVFVRPFTAHERASLTQPPR